MFHYQNELGLCPDEFLDCLRRSTLSQRRPIDEPDTIAGMLKNADVLITARTDSGLLIGISRAISDFHYCTYLSDLAVDQSFQRLGIGKELIAHTHKQAGLNTNLILLAAPAAQSYYPHIGMLQHPSAWMLARTRPSAQSDTL